MDEHLYLVTYDIGDDKRWRRIWRVMNGYGEWLQLSVFQCRLTRQRHAELVAALDEIMHKTQDHILLMDLGPADSVTPRVVSMGKEFSAVLREAVIV
jgi:CRISPR-associated protein Cas2